ncbi:MAG: hypothetical protein ACJ8C4_17500 [Gemmataceae bacterium]
MWWSWHHKRILAALEFAAREHWLSRVRLAIEENRVNGEEPLSIDALNQETLIRRNARNFDRVISGEYCVSNGFLLTVATALRIPVSELLPDNRKWIAQATHWLCGNKISAEEAFAYALFRESGLPTEEWEPPTAECDMSPELAREAAEKTIEVLDLELATIDVELLAKGRCTN